MKTESQNRQILDYLKSGRSLTAMEALVKFGSLRLAARIDYLRNRGHDITTKMIKGDGKRYARYKYSF